MITFPQNPTFNQTHIAENGQHYTYNGYAWNVTTGFSTVWGSVGGVLSSQTDLQAALDTKAPASHNHDLAYAAIGHDHDVDYSPLGHNHNGDYAPLVSGKVPAENLPSYVDDVLEYANQAALPENGETGKIYIALDNNKQFRWSGSVFVEITSTPVGPVWVDNGSEYETSDDILLSGVTYAYALECTGVANLNAGVVIGSYLVENAVQSSSTVIDVSSGSIFYKTLTGNSSFTFTNVPSGTNLLVSFTVEVTNSGGARTIDWSGIAGLKWPSGIVPSATTGVDVYTFYTRDGGNTWRGALVASYSS